MMKKLSILFAGESVVSQFVSAKGYDNTFCSRYSESHTGMKNMLESLGHSFVHVPCHRIHPDFPNTADKLKKYDVVLLSDIGSNTFLLDPEMCRTGCRAPNLLREMMHYVESGGGFGMIGGYLTFQGFEGKGNYRNTCIAQMLPVELMVGDDRIELPEGAEPICGPNRHPVTEGMPHKWPYVLGYNRLIAKPDAKVAVTVNEDPFVTLGSFGHGRTMAYATDCTAHWAPAAMTEWECYPELWNRLLCWLAGQGEE